jgi:hypothetical protein
MIPQKIESCIRMAKHKSSKSKAFTINFEAMATLKAARLRTSPSPPRPASPIMNVTPAA